MFSRLGPLVFALTLFLNGVLMFSLQPVLASFLLPKLGGTREVWNACMVFFGLATVAGYLYAYLTALPRWLRWQPLLHLLFLVVPVGLDLLGIGGQEALLSGIYIPPPGSDPVAGVYWLLVPVVGVPFLVAIANVLVLPRWFAETASPGANDPYFLHAATMLGSLVAVVSYPTLVEPFLTIRQQVKCWGVGYLAMGALVVACACLLWFAPRRAELPLSLGRPTMRRRLRWVAWSALAASLLGMAIDRYWTTFDYVSPIGSILHLPLYFAAAIMAFSRILPRVPAATWLAAQLALALVLFLIALLPLRSLMPVLPAFACALLISLILCVPERWALVLLTLTIPVLFWIVLTWHEHMAWPALCCYLLFLYLALRVCMGQLARDRPAPQFLTGFFVWMLVGDDVAKLLNLLPMQLAGYQELIIYPLVVGFAWVLVTGARGLWSPIEARPR